MNDLREIEDLIGRDATQCLVRDFGGRTIGIPKRATGTRMAQSVGDAAAGKLSEHFGGERVYIAKTPDRPGRNREIRRLRFEEGYSIKDLSPLFNLTERQIWNVLSSR
ncbi:MAG: hypothetical protein OXI69_15405 [Acidobacteriota bacterium]|nr:hypothetical protein [Acidobacteriota bacterium]